MSTPFCLPTSDLQTLLRSIDERLMHISCKGKLVRPPECKTFKDGTTQFKLLTEYVDKIVEYVHKLLQTTEPMRLSDDQFIEETPAAKRKLYKQVIDDLKGDMCDHKDSFIGLFLKCEKTNDQKDWVARLISPRHPRFNKCLGQFTKKVEKVLYTAIDMFWGRPSVMKGYNARDTAKHITDCWNTFVDPIAIGLDMSRFDQHIGKSALKFEHSFYLKIFKENRKEYGDLRTLLNKQLRNQYYARSTDGFDLKFRTAGTRCSGDMNTALGNVLIMCALLAHLKKTTNSKTMKIIDNGDDCVIMIERFELPLFNEDFITQEMLKFGFTVKVEPPVDTLQQVIFCQSVPIVDNTGKPCMVRSPYTALTKDTINCHLPKTLAEAKKWLGAIGDCGISLSSGIPMFTSFYNMLRRSSEGVRSKNGIYNLEQTGFAHMAKGMVNQGMEITEQTRYEFWLAFGIIPEVQRDVEKHYDNIRVDVTKLLSAAAGTAHIILNFPIFPSP